MKARDRIFLSSTTCSLEVPGIGNDFYICSGRTVSYKTGDGGWLSSCHTHTSRDGCRAGHGPLGSAAKRSSTKAGEMKVSRHKRAGVSTTVTESPSPLGTGQN